MDKFKREIIQKLSNEGVRVCFRAELGKIENDNIEIASFPNLDFTEHDKPFEKRIKLLQEENRKLYNQLMETEKDYQEEVERLSRKIDDYVESETMLIVENKELKRHLSDLKSKKAEENILSMTIICTEKINGQDYVRLEDFMSVVNDLQAQISTLKS